MIEKDSVRGCPGTALSSKALHLRAPQTHDVHEITSALQSASRHPRREACISPTSLFAIKYELKPTVDSAWQLARPPVLDRRCPRDSVPQEGPIRIWLQRRLQKVTPVRPKHRAIVGSDRGAGASRELRSEPSSPGNTLRRTRIGARRPLESAPSSRGHRHRLQGGVSGSRTV